MPSLMKEFQEGGAQLGASHFFHGISDFKMAREKRTLQFNIQMIKQSTNHRAGKTALH